MKKLILPVILLIIGTGAGVGAGLTFIEPATDAHLENPCGEPLSNDTVQTEVADQDASTNEYAKLSNQFIVPIVDNGRVSAMVVLSLSVEVAAGNKEPVFLAEPKLRDAFLQAMFDHANIGGFTGNFTSAQNLRPLRQDLYRRAKSVLPTIVKDVLIMDIVRQDV